MVTCYRDLLVWQKAMDLVVAGYRLSACFPRTETFALQTQLRRAAVSVPSNIAEGHGRNSTKEYLHHLSIANGSLMEMETQSLLAEKLGYVPHVDTTNLLDKSAEVGKLLNGLINALNRKLQG